MRQALLLLPFIILFPVLAAAEPADPYTEYIGRLNTVAFEEDIAANGFTVLVRMREEFYNFGAVDVIAALDSKYGRMILFFVDTNGRVVFKTDCIESNCRNRGELKQDNRSLTAIDFMDMNHDGLKDIIIICSCRGADGTEYRIGDVLFQNDKGFYRDWRVSDKLNRFSMNRNIDIIAAFVRDGQSTEFLYTAKTLDELLENGFRVIAEQSFDMEFEKFGRVSVMSGTYTVFGQTLLMIYLVNPDGRIVWNFQFMNGEYDFDAVAVRGIAFRDIDGDALKDVVVLIQYSSINDKDVLTSDYFIFYQRAGYFQEAVDFKKTYACSEEDVLDTITQRARAFWGW